MPEKTSKELYDEKMQLLERQQKKLRDNYNTLEDELNQDYYVERLKSISSIRYAIRPEETIKDYMPRLLAYMDVSEQNDYDRHKGWYTHTKDPRGCVSCEPHIMCRYLTLIIAYYSKKYPTSKPSA